MAMKETERDAPGSSAALASPAFMLQGVVPLPTPLRLKDGDAKENWRRWKQLWEVVSGLKSQPKAYRFATFVTCVGHEALDLCDAMQFESERDKTDIDKILEALEGHVMGLVNITYERFLFNKRDQQQGESFNDYLTTLKGMIRTCEYGMMAEELLRDRLICGIKEDGFRKTLLQKRNLTFTMCTDICRMAEVATKQMKSIAETDTGMVQVVRRQDQDSQSKGYVKRQEQRQINCHYCGNRHLRGKDKCPAFGKECQLCGKWNHVASVCRSRTASKVHAVSTTVEEEELMTVDVNPECVATVSGGSPTKIYVKLIVQGKQVTFQLDTGATCNILSSSDLPPGVEIVPTMQKLTLFDASLLQPLGKCHVKVMNPKNGNRYKGEFVVVDKSSTSLLGARSIQQMSLMTVRYDNILQVTQTDINKTARDLQSPLTLAQVLYQYNEVFDNKLGTLPGQIHLEVDQSITPMQEPVRRVPVAVKETLIKEIEDMEKDGVIKKVDEPTDWISPLVIVKKPNGRLRICMDPKQLNRALKRAHYLTVTVDEILPQLSKAKVFSVCDVKSGFWHVVLDEESSYLTTFGTPIGRLLV